MREYLLTRGIVPSRCPWCRCRRQSSLLTIERHDTFTLYTCNACPYGIKKIHEDGITQSERDATYRRRHN